MKTLQGPNSLPIAFLGPSLEEGRKPAFFYFALSAEESLTLAPYNQPTSFLSEEEMRVFSFTLPGHGPGFDKYHAMAYWVEKLTSDNLLEAFFQQALEAIEWLIAHQLVDPGKMAVGGLSRGGFIATHLAARDKRIKTVVAFAPLTRLDRIKESAEKKGDFLFEKMAESLNLVNCVDALTHLQQLFFSIGNFDMRVGTEECFAFIHALAKCVHDKKARHCLVEMKIHPSIGHQGHGTPPHVFQEGAMIVKKHLLGKEN